MIDRQTGLGRRQSEPATGSARTELDAHTRAEGAKPHRQALPGTKAYRSALVKLLRADMSYDEFLRKVDGSNRR